ncbi:hypothetical protein D3C72_2474510 [compost metagenome]
MRPMASTAIWAMMETVTPVRIGLDYCSGWVMRPILEKPPADSRPMTRMTAP